MGTEENTGIVSLIPSALRPQRAGPIRVKRFVTLFITPGSPWENGYSESFFDKLRDECLNREVFRNGREAQAIVETWRQEYNNYRSHSSLDYLTPAEFARRYYEDKQKEEAAQPGGNSRDSLIVGGTKIGGTP